MSTTASPTHQKIVDRQSSVGRIIKVKGEPIELAIVALLAEGHLLIEDVPGVGKTTLGHSLAMALGSTFHRLQFTSDLLPETFRPLRIGISPSED